MRVTQGRGEVHSEWVKMATWAHPPPPCLATYHTMWPQAARAALDLAAVVHLHTLLQVQAGHMAPWHKHAGRCRVAVGQQGKGQGTTHPIVLGDQDL